MWSCVLGLVFSVSTFSWIRSACVLENVIDMTKNIINIILLRSFPNIYLSYPWLTKHAYACHQQDVFIYFAQQFLYLSLNLYISNISNIYNQDQNSSLESQTIGNHMFSDLKSDHTFHFFGYVPGVYIFLLVCSNFPLTSNMVRCWNPL